MIAVVVPTVGRPSLARLLRSLADQDLAGTDLTGPEEAGLEPARPAQRLPIGELVLVDDRPAAEARRRPLAGLPGVAEPLARLQDRMTVRLPVSGGRGPAAARNLGWRGCRSGWVAFLDDDVVLPQGWARLLRGDLRAAAPDVAAVAGRIEVPVPEDRLPTDDERGTLGLRTARWATADLVVRMTALDRVCGFDERFRRAYREDADLALRLRADGWQLVVGGRTVIHPLRPTRRLAGLKAQRGNADDALMRAAHGRGWREQAEAPAGTLRRHVAVVGCAALAVAAGSRRGAAVRALGAVAAATGGALVGDFTAGRVLAGPRTPDEVADMLVSSVLIPPAAVGWRLAGTWRHRRAQPWPGPVRAVLFDRDGTLVHDVPYNGDPALVRPVEGAAAGVAAVRSAGLSTGLVTNQSGVALGLLDRVQVGRVNDRVAGLLGHRFDVVQVCPHDDADGCDCRKPAPGMVIAAAERLGVPARQVVLVGDIGADLLAARAAGARGVLVPGPATRPEEVDAAAVVVPSIEDAVRLVLDGMRPAARVRATGPRAIGLRR